MYMCCIMGVNVCGVVSGITLCLYLIYSESYFGTVLLLNSKQFART